MFSASYFLRNKRPTLHHSYVPGMYMYRSYNIFHSSIRRWYIISTRTTPLLEGQSSTNLRRIRTAGTVWPNL